MDNQELSVDEMVVKTREIFLSQIIYELEQDPSLQPQQLQKLLYEAMKSRLEIFQENQQGLLEIKAPDFMPVINKTIHDFFQARKYENQ